MPAVSLHVPTVMLNSLTGFGFKIDGQSQTCEHFVTRLKKFIAQFCHYYEVEIANELAKPGCLKRREDFDSWAINEITQILFEAIGRYRDRIADSESIGQHKIGCDQALTYFVWLIDSAETAKRAKLDQQAQIPSSKKFERKRKSNRWTPYPVNVSWDELVRMFGGTKQG